MAPPASYNYLPRCAYARTQSGPHYYDIPAHTQYDSYTQQHKIPRYTTTPPHYHGFQRPESQNFTDRSPDSIDRTTINSNMKKLYNTLRKADTLYHDAFVAFSTAIKGIKDFLPQNLLSDIWTHNIQYKVNASGEQVPSLEQKFMDMAADLCHDFKRAERAMAQTGDRMVGKIRAARHDMEAHDATKTCQDCKAMSLDIRELMYTIENRFDVRKTATSSAGSGKDSTTSSAEATTMTAEANETKSNGNGWDNSTDGKESKIEDGGWDNSATWSAGNDKQAGDEKVVEKEPETTW